MLRVRCDGGALTAGRAAHPRRDLDRVRPRHRRHLRPRERPVPLDPRSRTCRRSGGGSTRSACRPPRPAATARASCWARRWPATRSTRCIDGTPGDRRDRQALHRQARVLEPAAQVQDRDLGPAGRRARGQRRRVHRRQPPRARPRLRPVGRRRPVHQPDAGPAGRRLGAARRGARRVGGRGLGVPRLRLPPAARQGAAEVPDQGLGHREIPGGARRRVPEAPADRRARARAGRPGPSTTSACRG